MAKTLDQNIMAVLATSGPMLTPDQLSGLGNGFNYQVENLYSKIDDSIRRIDQSTFGPQEEEINICETPMCIAGHTVHLAGHQGFLLAKRIGWGPAAQIIHRQSRPDIPAPRYDSYPTEWARAYISIHAAEERRRLTNGMETDA